MGKLDYVTKRMGGKGVVQYSATLITRFGQFVLEVRRLFVGAKWGPRHGRALQVSGKDADAVVLEAGKVYWVGKLTMVGLTDMDQKVFAYDPKVSVKVVLESTGSVRSRRGTDRLSGCTYRSGESVHVATWWGRVVSWSCGRDAVRR